MRDTVARLKLSALVGKCVQVDWRDVFNSHTGRLTAYNKDGTFQVTYADGNEDNTSLHKLSTRKSTTSKFGYTHNVFEWCIIAENRWG